MKQSKIRLTLPPVAMRLALIIIVTAALSVLPTANAASESEQATPAAEASPWMLGVGYVQGANPFVAEPDGVATALPIVGYSGERLTWLGPFLSYRVSNADSRFDFRLASSVRFQGFSYDGNDPRLAGVSDRKSALDIGGSVRHGAVKLALLGDVSGRYNGYEVALSYDHVLSPNRRTQLTLSANVTQQSENLVDYYYGVPSGQATAIRPAYRGDSATNFGIGADLNFFFTRQWMLMGRARVTALDDAIADSPIVEDDYESSLMLGIVYRFGNND